MATTPPPPPPQIRHAGRAEVRGKIRRVWRPRYLELLDQGIVHYYEFPPPPSPTDEGPAAGGTPWGDSYLWAKDEPPSLEDNNNEAVPQQYSTSPKYTLQISHARILDVTTLRDMHVGLPRGTFGFVFRGQRLVHLEQQQQQGGMVVDPDVTVLESRDFLCAVPTLEEAQMWVVALQWAASERMVVESMHELEQQRQNQQQQQIAIAENDGSIVTADDSGSGGGFVNVPSSSSLAGSAHLDETTTPAVSQQPPPARSASSPSAGGKIVVTKVTAVRTVRISRWQWEVAYEIHGLFLTKGGGSNGRAELWTALRTADDLLQLVHALYKELGKQADSSDPQLLWKPLEQLPRLLGPRQHASPHAFWRALVASISTVDGILRSLVTDAAMVQATAMKRFLGLPTTKKTKNAPLLRQPSSLTRRLWEFHNGTALVERRVMETITTTTTPDLFVKQWLQQQQQRGASNSKKLDALAAYCLQQPLVVLGGATVSSVAALWPLAKWAASLYDSLVPTLSLRADVLVITWIGAAYLGYQYNLHQHQHAGTLRATKKAQNVQAKKEQPAAEERLERHKVAPGETSEVEDDDTDHGDDASSSSEGESAAAAEAINDGRLSSPLPKHPDNDGKSCWSQPPHDIFHVRSKTYLKDRVKEPSGPAPFTCLGVDVWMTDNPERNISRHPAVLGGKLPEQDTFLVNFLLPFGNFVAYFAVPPLSQFPSTTLQNVWTQFLQGDQQYRDARLKLLPVVAEGPWIVKAAVGPGKSPALLGKVIPLQYYFTSDATTAGRTGGSAIYEVDVIITASSIAKGILSVVKGNTKCVSIAFAFIIEAAKEDELPETVLCSCQVHSLHLEQCPILPPNANSDDDDPDALLSSE